MKWEESLKYQLYADGRKRSYEKLYRISRLAYLKGCSEEKKESPRSISAMLQQAVWQQMHAVYRKQSEAEEAM